MKKIKKELFLTILLIVTLILLVGYILIDKLILADKGKTLKKEDNKSSEVREKTTSITQISKVISDSISKQDIIDIAKDYNKEQEMYEEEKTEFWVIDSVKYLGYFNTSPDTLYYVFTGTYKCKDNTDECVYTENENDESEDGIYKYIGGITIKDNKATTILPPTYETLIKSDPEESLNFVFIDEIIK